MLGDKMKPSKKQIYFSIATVAAIFVVGTFIVNEQYASASLHTTQVIDYTGDVPNHVYTMKKGQTLIIPVSIMAAKEKSYDLKVGVTSAGTENIFAITGNETMPQGITATVDKKVINLQATTEKGIAQRDSVNMTIIVNPDAQVKKYPLSFVLSNDLGNGVTSHTATYVYINVQQ